MEKERIFHEIDIQDCLNSINHLLFLQLLQKKEGKLTAESEDLGDTILCVCYCPNGEKGVVGLANGQVMVSFDLYKLMIYF